MQKEKKYLKDLLKLLFDQFREKSGVVGDIEVYKAPDLNFIEQSEKIADVFFTTDEFVADEKLKSHYENEWMGASDVFDYFVERYPKSTDVKHEMIFSYVTTGATGTVTSFNLFVWDKKAIFYETADEFTPGMYRIEPVNTSTDLTKLTITYFLKEGFPSVDLFSIDLNTNWIDSTKFQEMLLEKLNQGMASGKSKFLTERLWEMVNGHTKKSLRSKVKQKDLEVILEFRDGRHEQITPNVIESIVPYLFEKKSKLKS